MEINLLPHVPTTKKYRFQIALIIGLILVIFSAFIGFQIWYKTNQIENKKIILQQLKSSSNSNGKVLSKEQRRSQLIKSYQEEYTVLKSTNINWVPIVDKISGILPNDAHILQMDWTNDGMLKMSGEFSSLDSVGQFLQLLSGIEWIEDAQLVNAQTSSADGRVQVLLNVKMNSESLFSFNHVLPGGDQK